MLLPMSPTSSLFLLSENREAPMHVGSLQLYEPPEGADALDVRALFEQVVADTVAAETAAAESGTTSEAVSPLFRKRARRSITSLGQWGWEADPGFDLEWHVRRSALPGPGRVLELLALVSRLHSTLLDRTRPLWEMHFVEGLADGRYAVYQKVHHSMVDGVSALRMLSRTLSEDPDKAGMPAPWAPLPSRARSGSPAPRDAARSGVNAVAHDAWSALGDAVGFGPALARTIANAVRDQAGTMSLSAPRSMLNVPITGARRFAAQAWPIERLRTVAKASDTTLNDVVLSMTAGALRRYMIELDALPDAPLVAMVPVSLKGTDADGAARDSGDGGGNSIGVVMAGLGTDLDDPADRLAAVHRSMAEGKQALASMSQLQIMAMSALGVSPLALWPLLGRTAGMRPPFNLVISNVPGPREQRYWNGARLDGLFPLSIPVAGQALNITCTSYADDMSFGLTGCRRSVPHLQRLLTHLDDELAAMERAAGAA